jgi:hypothetical protein
MIRDLIANWLAKFNEMKNKEGDAGMSRVAPTDAYVSREDVLQINREL